MKDLKHLLDISYPIIQAPMLGMTTPAMVAAVANAGGLGSMPLAHFWLTRGRSTFKA